MPETNEPPAGSPVMNLAPFQCIKRVTAGEIIEVVAAGCFVKMRDGDAVLLMFEDGMTSRYMPVVGDFWVRYEDGYQAISPRAAFLKGYVPVGHMAPGAVGMFKMDGTFSPAQIEAFKRAWQDASPCNIDSISVEEGVATVQRPASLPDETKFDIVEWLRKAIEMGDGGLEGERRHAEAMNEIIQLRGGITIVHKDGTTTGPAPLTKGEDLGDKY
jgi:hypothetical protein